MTPFVLEQKLAQHYDC